MRQRVRPAAVAAALRASLDRWVEAELITEDQAARIAAHEAALDRSVSFVAEALGYVGGVVMVVGATVLAGAFWRDVPTFGRLLLTGTTAVLLAGAGLVVPQSRGPAAVRIRSVLWVLCTVATGGFTAVLGAEILHRGDYHLMVIVGAACAVTGTALWHLQPTWLQHVSVFVALGITADGIGLEASSGDSRWGATALFALGAAWTLVGYRHWIEPRTTAVVCGLLGAALACLMMDNDAGTVLGLLTSVVAIALALTSRSLPWLGVGAVTLLGTGPRAANRWFPGQLSASLTFILAGAVLVAAALWVSRRTSSRT